MERPKRLRSRKLVASLLVLSVVGAFGVGYILAASSLTPNTISSGSMVSNYSYTIFADGAGTYYARNGTTGAIDYESSNFSYVFQSCINALPKVIVVLPIPNSPTIAAPCGIIAFSTQQFATSKVLQIPLGSRLTLQGGGISFQQCTNGQKGGTQINSTDPNGILIALDYGQLTNGTNIHNISGSELEFENIEFIQGVTLSNSNSAAVILNGGSQGILSNVVITGYKYWETMMDGWGLKIDCWQYVGYWRWDRVQIEGFKNGILDYTNHLEASQVGIAVAKQPLMVWVNSNHHYQDLHLFYVSNCLTVTGGDDILKIDGMYVESFINDTSYYAWWANTTLFKGKVIIDKCAVNVADSRIWTFFNGKRFLFDHVETRRSVFSGFPNATTPTIQSAYTFENTLPMMVEVHISGGTVSSIVVRGISTGMTSGVFILYPQDTISITYSSAPSWCWLSLADAKHIT